MEYPTVINWNSLFPIKGLLGVSFHFYSNFDKTICKQKVETRSAASGLGLHCLTICLIKWMLCLNGISCLLRRDMVDVSS